MKGEFPHFFGFCTLECLYPSYFVWFSLFDRVYFPRLWVKMANSTPQTRHYWIFSTDPHHYHCDTLFVKGKEMSHGAGTESHAILSLKQLSLWRPGWCEHS